LADFSVCSALLKELRRPLDNIKVAKVGRSMQYEHCPYLHKKNGICEISAYNLTNPESIKTVPNLKSNEEISRLLKIEHLPFFEKITILTKVKTIWK
jgi:hypothetical protein